MSSYHALLILHLLGVFVLLMGEGIAFACGIMRTKTSNVSAIAAYTRMSLGMATWFLRIGGIGLLIAGAMLVTKSGHSMGDAWVSASFTLWIIAFGIGEGVLHRNDKKILARAHELEVDGVHESEELRMLASAPVGAIFGTVELVIIAVFLYLMVMRPGS